MIACLSPLLLIYFISWWIALVAIVVSLRMTMSCKYLACSIGPSVVPRLHKSEVLGCVCFYLSSMLGRYDGRCNITWMLYTKVELRVLLVPLIRLFRGIGWIRCLACFAYLTAMRPTHYLDGCKAEGLNALGGSSSKEPIPYIRNDHPLHTRICACRRIRSRSFSGESLQLVGGRFCVP